MFQFRRFPTYAYFVQRTLTEYCSAGFPHSEIPGSMPMCGSPRLIAACHVLLRLSMPRHSPCALISLTSSERTSYPSLPCKHKSSLTPSLLLFLANPLALGFARIDSGSHQELCRLQIRFIVVLCYPFKKSTKVYFVTSLLLARNFLLAFTVQFSRCRPLILFQDQIEMLGRLPKHFNLFLVEVTGLEPVTPCLQSKCSTS